MIYKVILYKQLNLIPEIFKISYDEATNEQKLKDKIMLGLNGNAILFVDIKGKTRVYDRNIITKIFIKEA